MVEYLGNAYTEVSPFYGGGCPTFEPPCEHCARDGGGGCCGISQFPELCPG